MLKKSAFVLLLLLLLGSMAMPEVPGRWVQAGEQGFLLRWGEIFGADPQAAVVYNPGLRDLGVPLHDLQVYSVPPNTGRSFQKDLERFFRSGARVLVECSALDTWHTSTEGSKALPKIRKSAYRVVVFDGGHHLPTLGLEPDIIIVPVYKGYAAHGYMKDGIKVETLIKLLEKSQSPTVLVTVSRWRLVKEEACMETVCKKVLEQLSIRSQSGPAPVFACRPRMSRRGNQVYIYMEKEYAVNRQLLLQNCRELEVKGTDEVYAAFDYAYTKPGEAQKICRWLQETLGVPVKCVNDPVKVTDLIF